MPAPAPAAAGSSRTDSAPVSGHLPGILSSLRERTARGLVQHHYSIAEPDLNFVVLCSILRVLFLRAGEGCGYTGPGTLALLADSEGIGRRLARACSDAGLGPDALLEPGPYRSRHLPEVPDESLREIIRILGGVEFPVPFSGTALHELAAVFEHYLGTTMRITEGSRLKAEGKSAVRYTGGAHVTPQPVADSTIVESVSALTGKKDGGDRGALRILDPACGPGIFLLAAYRHRARQDTGMFRSTGGTAPGLPGNALGSVYGTDIDPEAVATARFILLLAAIGEYDRAGAGPAQHGRIRTIAECLSTHIRCGNALIAPDYFSGRQEHPFNAEERRKVNAFDWQAAFPAVLAQGGFDLVTGSPPPYRPFAIPARDEYFQTHYGSYAQGAALYGFFIEKGLQLLRPGGILAFCVPGTFLRAHQARPLRRLLLTQQILDLTDTGGSRMLQGSDARLFILRIAKNPPHHPFVVGKQDAGSGTGSSSPAHLRQFPVDQRLLGDGGWTLEDRRETDLLEKIRRAGTPLEHYVMGQIDRGTIRIRNNPLVIDQGMKNRLVRKGWQCRRFFVPLLRPHDIARYVPEKPARFVITGKSARDLKRCRALEAYLRSVAENPAAVPESGESPGAASSPAAQPVIEPVPFQNVPKIIFAPYQHLPAFACDPAGSYAITGMLAAIPRHDPVLAAILNSSLGRFLIARHCPLTDRGYHLSPALLGKIPVYTPDLDRVADRARHDKITALVTQMLTLHGYLPKAKTDQEKRLVRQEIEATDVKIDALVYELYGLTAEEIAVIEETIR